MAAGNETIESLAIKVTALTVFANSLTSQSKFMSQLANQASIVDNSEVHVIQKGTDDAKEINTATLRGILGDWNGSANSPTLVDGTGIAGDSYFVTVAGVQDFGDGSIIFLVGDIVKYISNKWKVRPSTVTGAVTTNFSSILPPQLFNPDAAAVIANTDIYTLSNTNDVAFLTINGKVIDDAEYSLSGFSLTVTPVNGFDDIDDEVLVFQHVFSASSNIGDLENRVIVRQVSDFGTIDSTKEYFLDGIIDMGSTSIEVPSGGISLQGYNLEISGLTSSENNYTMFTSPVGGSGNFLGMDVFFTTSGTTSQVYDLVADTGGEAHEISRVNYTNCTSLGEIDGYRQGLETGTGRFGGTPNLILSGTWAGGYFIDTSIVRGLTDGSYALYEEGTSFTMASRFRSNQNIDLPASASFFDFAPSNFTNPSTVQIDGVIITRNGVFDATDSNITPNMVKGDLTANWSGNNGMPNTFVGGAIGITTETTTTITVDGQFEDLDATLWTSADLQHFDAPSGNHLRHLGNTPREYKVIASFALDSTANNVISLRVSKFDSSAASSSVVLTQTRQVNNLVGGRDVAFFNININTTLDENDYIFLEVANIGATNDITAEVDSYYIVESR